MLASAYSTPIGGIGTLIGISPSRILRCYVAGSNASKRSSFGSGYLKIPSMIKTGLWMKLVSILFKSILVYFFFTYNLGF